MYLHVTELNNWTTISNNIALGLVQMVINFKKFVECLENLMHNSLKLP